MLTGQMLTGQMLTGQMLTGQILTGKILTGQMLTGQMLTNKVVNWTNAHQEKKTIKEKRNKFKNEMNDKCKHSFRLFTFCIVNYDCNKRSPQFYMIAIMDTIIKD